MIADKTKDYRNNEIDKPIYTTLVQGENVYIQSDGVISAKDDNTVYTAGTGISIVDGVISVSLESADTDTY